MNDRAWRILSCVGWPATVAASAVLTGLAHAQPCAMRMFDFAGLQSGATDVSSDGRTMVGWIGVPQSSSLRAFHWTQSGGLTVLGTEVRQIVVIFLSADGSVTAGTENPPGSVERPFIWTASDGLRNLETSPGHRGTLVSDISADGSTVVGYERTSNGGFMARRWTIGGDARSLGTLGGAWSQSTAVSDDGSVVVGYAYNEQGRYRAFRWTSASGMQDLGSLGGPTSRATALSADGSVVVGYSSNLAGQWRAFRWTSSEGMQNLGSIGAMDARAYAVSADGSVVYGRDRDAGAKLQIFRWTSDGLTWVGVPGELYDFRLWASRDGRALTAFGFDAESRRQAFRWTLESGTEWLGAPAGMETRPTGISADGLTVVGQGRAIVSGADRAFRWHPCPGDFNQDCFLDFFDYADFVACFEADQCPGAADADFNGDGFVDPFDYADFVQAFESGC